jgi:hypothetical protein
LKNGCAVNAFTDGNSGLPPPIVRIDRAGQITIMSGKPRDDDQTNEWDEVCTATGDEATR